MEFNIALLRGDGIGPEIVDSAVLILKKTAEKFGHKFNFTPYLIGGAAIDATGNPLPKETVEGCLASDSVLLGVLSGITFPATAVRKRLSSVYAPHWVFLQICVPPSFTKRLGTSARSAPILPLTDSIL